MTAMLKRLRALPMRNLQTRILALFLLLIFVVQVGGFVLINTVGGNSARSTVGAQVVAGTRVFDRLLEQDAQRLVQGARLMAADYAFREVIATGDHDTIGSVLVNYGKRIEAPLVMIVSLDQKVVGDTLDIGTGKPFALPRLLDQAEVHGTGVRDGRPARRALPAGRRAGAGSGAHRMGSRRPASQRPADP